MEALVWRLDGLAQSRLRRRIPRPAAGKLPLQLLVNTRGGELGRHPDTVVDRTVIGRAMAHDANPTDSQERSTAILGIIYALLEVVERFA